MNWVKQRPTFSMQEINWDAGFDWDSGIPWDNPSWIKIETADATWVKEKQAT